MRGLDDNVSTEDTNVLGFIVHVAQTVESIRKSMRELDDNVSTEDANILGFIVQVAQTLNLMIMLQ